MSGAHRSRILFQKVQVGCHAPGRDSTIVSVDSDYESIQMGGGEAMLLPGASGTAVTTALGD